MVVCQVEIIERCGKRVLLVVEDPAFAVKIVHVPAAVVEQFIVTVIQSTSAVHAVVFPKTVIIAVIFIVK